MSRFVSHQLTRNENPGDVIQECIPQSYSVDSVDQKVGRNTPETSTSTIPFCQNKTGATKWASWSCSSTGSLMASQPTSLYIPPEGKASLNPRLWEWSWQKLIQGGTLPVVNGVITPISRVITPVIHFIPGHIYRGPMLILPTGFSGKNPAEHHRKLSSKPTGNISPGRVWRSGSFGSDMFTGWLKHNLVGGFNPVEKY